jgi:carbamoyltransferase
MRTEMDVLVIDDFVLYKKEQPEYQDKGNWKDEFELD